MISSLSSTSRRRRALRATLFVLVSLTGCQGSLRTWRRDDPSLRDLVVTPHPWDQPPARREDYGNQPGRDRDARGRNGRANPYAAQSMAAGEQRSRPGDDRDEGYVEEESYVNDPRYIDPDEDAEIRREIDKAAPSQRAYLQDTYAAMRDLANTKKQAEREAAQTDDSTVEREYPVRQASATRSRDGSDELGNRPASNRLSDAPRSPKQQSGAVHYKLGDQGDQEDNHQQYAERPAVTKPRSSNSTNKPTDKTSNPSQSRPQGKTTYSARPDDVKPPPKSAAQKRPVKELMADTGYEDRAQGVSVKRIPPDATSNRKYSAPPVRGAVPVYNGDSEGEYSEGEPSAEEGDPMEGDQGDGVDEHYTDSTVIQASATSTNRSQAAPVQTATTNQVAHGQTSSRTGQAAKAMSTESDDWRVHGERMLRALDKTSAESPSDLLNVQGTKRYAAALLGHMGLAMEPIPDMPTGVQEYVRNDVQAIFNLLDRRGNPEISRRLPLVMDNERMALSHASSEADLQVKNTAFCSDVKGFGSITKFPSYQFKAGQELLLYCEVDNFVSRPIKGGFETKLCGRYTIFDAQQKRVAEFQLPEETEVCSSPRRDYFFAYRIYLPQSIAPGRYQFQLSIEDMKGSKYGHSALDIQITQ